MGIKWLWFAYSIIANYFLNRDVETYVDPMITRGMYNNTYQYNIF